MPLRTHFPAIVAGLLTCLGSLSASSPTNTGGLTPPESSPDTNIPPATAAVDEALRQLKEQQASATQALELILDHTESALHRNAVTVSNQLAQFSVALADYSDRQFQLVRSTENRTLRVTLFILLVVVLTAAALLLLAARALRALTLRFSGTPAFEPAPMPPPLMEQTPDAAYSMAIMDVEKRIMALESRQVAAAGARDEKAAPSVAASSGARATPAPKLRSSGPLALALGSGEALMFLPRDQTQPAERRGVSALSRIGRLFQRGSSRNAPGSKTPRE
ncbi:MAG: hypothetical protein QOF48_1134 [Verrucomicrobiota bacterium]|jgi:hypothetical protein